MTLKIPTKNVKRQLWKRKSCLAGPGRLLPLCTPPPPLYKVGQNDIYSFALLSLLCSIFCLFILLFCHFFSFKTTFSCLLSSDSKTPYLRNVQREGGAVGIFCRVGCCWILSGHRLIRTTLYILFLSRPHFLKQASMRTLFSVCVEMFRWYWNLFAFLQAMDWLWMSTYLDRVRHQVLLPGTDQYLTLSLTEKISPQFYIFTNIPSCLYADVFTVKSHQIRLFVNILRQCLSRRGTFGKSLL